MVGGAPVHISSQENYKLLLIIAFVQLLAEPLEDTSKTPVENNNNDEIIE